MLIAIALLLAQLQPLPPSLVPLDSPEGERMLFESTARRPYLPLAAQFVTQRDQSFCGVASAVMVLNALPLRAPIATGMAPFRAFTQDNVFAAVTNGLDAAFVNRGGMTLAHLEALLQQNGAQVQPVYASEATLDRFRGDAVRALSQPNHHVLVDFSRASLNQDLGAHWSPLAAYHAGSDRFLVLDVARVRYPPYWARAADLFAGMDTRDLDSGRSRGYLLVQAQPGAPGRAAVPTVKHRVVRFAALAVLAVFSLGAAAGAAWMRWRLRRA